MNQAEVTSVLHIFIGLIVLVWFFYGPWQYLVVDGVRQRLFELRDELFDLARAGEIDFADPAYCYARKRINANIRFAHKASVWRVIAVRHIVNELPNLPDMPNTRAECGTKIRKLLRQSNVLIIGSMWLRSPALILLTGVIALPVAWILILGDIMPILRAQYVKFTSTMTREAMAEKSSVTKSWTWQS